MKNFELECALLFSWSVVLWKFSQSPLGFLLIDLLIYFWKNLSQKGNPTEEGFQSRSLSSESSLRMETVLHNHKYQRTGHWTETTYSGLYSCIQVRCIYSSIHALSGLQLLLPSSLVQWYIQYTIFHEFQTKMQRNCKLFMICKPVQRTGYPNI